MIDITKNLDTLKTSIAKATISVSDQNAMNRLSETNAEGILAIARSAAMLAVKKTDQLIPTGHSIAIEQISITFSQKGLSMGIEVKVSAICKSSLFTHALHAASSAALSILDMLESGGDRAEIVGVYSLDKISTANRSYQEITAAIVVCSDSVSAGKAADLSGEMIKKGLEGVGLADVALDVVADEIGTIRAKALELVEAGNKLVIFTGGTGLSPRDVTPEAILPILDRPIDGIIDAARQYGQQRTPYAMLSRGVAGFIKKTLIITFPGSPSAAEDYLESLFPYVLHLFEINKGQKH